LAVLDKKIGDEFVIISILLLFLHYKYTNMTQKEFLSNLQHKSKFDKQQTSALLSALTHILANEAIAGNIVEIDNLGQFVSHKHTEFVQKSKETGESILYPPRISYRFNSFIKLPK